MDSNSIDFSNIKVFVFGDVMIDQYWKGNIERISSEAPIPILLQKTDNYTLGGAANVALNLLDLGATPILSGFIGVDEGAIKLTSLCEKYKLSTIFIPNENYVTIVKLRIISQNQQLIRVDFENANIVDSFNKEALWNQYKDSIIQAINESAIVILSDYNGGMRQLFPYVIEVANKLGKPILVDPKGIEIKYYKNSTLVKSNYKEFCAIASHYGFHKETIENDEEKVIRHIIKDMGLQYYLITKSAQGMTLYGPDNLFYHQKTAATEVFDVTGAGDTVIATIALVLAKHQNIKRACYIANKAAGITVSKRGTTTVNIKELAQSLNIQDITAFTQTNLKTLLDQIKNAKAKGEVIVFTNGCFDILHRGHLTYLAKAKQLGDRLIVAVNSDDSVRRLKGKSRPINTLADRMLMLSSLKFVDWVIDFSEDTPLELIKAIMPDYLVKGSDYTINQIPGATEVMANNGQVILLDFVDNYSTSKIIDKIHSKTSNI